MDKYKNPDTRCSYPYQPNDALDYCWGYADKIDNNKTKEEIESMCNGCEFWKEVSNV